MTSRFAHTLQDGESIRRESGYSLLWYPVNASFAAVGAIIAALLVMAVGKGIMSLQQAPLASLLLPDAAAVGAWLLIVRRAAAALIVGVIGVELTREFILASNVRYCLTGSRLMTRYGVLSNNQLSADLKRVQDVSLRQSLLGRMLDVGDLIVETAGTNGAIELRNVDDPHGWMREIYSLRDKA